MVPLFDGKADVVQESELDPLEVKVVKHLNKGLGYRDLRESL